MIGGTDLAILSIDKKLLTKEELENFKPLPLAPFVAQIGDKVYIVGNTLGLGTQLNPDKFNDVNNVNRIAYELKLNPEEKQQYVNTLSESDFYTLSGVTQQLTSTSTKGKLYDVRQHNVFETIHGGTTHQGNSGSPITIAINGKLALISMLFEGDNVHYSGANDEDTADLFQ